MYATPPISSQHFARNRARRGVLFIALLLVLFVALAIIARSPGLLRFDTAITRTLQEAHNDPLDYLAYCFTLLGNGTTLTILCIGLALFLATAGKRVAALFSLATLLSMPLNVLLKEIVHRPRPTADLVRILFPARGASFPSGHAMASVIIYGFLAYLAWTFLHDVPRRRFWVALLALLPIGISLSRVYLGVHWFSDIIGAWMFGLVVLLLMARLYKHFGAKEHTSLPNLRPSPEFGEKEDIRNNQEHA